MTCIVCLAPLLSASDDKSEAKMVAVSADMADDVMRRRGASTAVLHESHACQTRSVRACSERQQTSSPLSMRGRASLCSVCAHGRADDTARPIPQRTVYRMAKPGLPMAKPEGAELGA